jgi:hypothetical protein
MREALKLADWPGCARRCVGPVYWALALAGLGCRTEATVSSAASAKSEAPYVCDEAHDYRVFDGSVTLAGVNAQVPRREQTMQQAESLTPGDPLWQFQEKPEVRCSADGLLELRYAVPAPSGFSAARNRMTVSIAPGARLLDPQAHARMKALAEAADEALALLRTKSCSDSGAPCDLQRNPDPLRFPGTRAQYAVGSEFKQIGRRAWFWQFVKDQRQVLRAIFCTTDGRFDVEVLVEIMDAADGGFGALGLIPELLSDEYDKRLRLDGGFAEGGSRG